ncbi:MAG: glycerophosphodiester phosphodiesterase [Chloroflexi bacterium]|nr:glycerophosphodiester phosphodiesterase [Chloroflexota bacterium]
MDIDTLLAEHGTLVFGHRGASGYASENTMESFGLALDQGAHGIEFDVHLTADGVPVVIHDFDVHTTTDGQGKVADLTLEQVQALNASGPKWPAHAPVQVPTLDQVLSAFAGKLIFNIEVKADTADIEHKVADLVDRYGVGDAVVVSSFNPVVLRRFSAAYPTTRIGYLYMDGEPYTQLAQMMTGVPIYARHPYHQMIDAAYMRIARQYGYKVNTWTVNDPERARELRDLEVDVVMTDYPDRILHALSS